jgi:DNA-binding response OmpR family regulator
MPRLEGVDVVRTLRADSDPYFWTVPIVLMTAKVGPENTTTGFAAGVTDYLVKPLIPSLVRARVRAWLLRRDASTRGAM